MVTRCVRLQVKVSREDSIEMKRARDDLRLAANRVMRRLYLHQEQPSEQDGVPPQTIAYRCMSGIKGEELAYNSTTQNPVSGGCRSAVATLVYQRWREDVKYVSSGEKSLATFRRLPLVFRRQEVRVVDHERVDLFVWGRPNPRWVSCSVKPQGSRYKSVWRAIVLGTLRSGDARLQLDRKGRWYMLLSHGVLTPEVSESGGVVRVSFQPQEFARADFFDPDGKHSAGEVFYPPVNFWRLWMQDLAVRRQIGRANRKDYGLRAGKGRKKKIAPLDRRRARYQGRVEDAIRVVANALVTWAESHGARAIALPSVKGQVEDQQDATEDIRPRETRAELRSKFLRRNRTKLLERIRVRAERSGLELEGYTVRGVAPSGTPDESAFASREAETDEGQASETPSRKQPLARSARTRATRVRQESRGSRHVTKEGSKRHVDRPVKKRKRNE